MRIVFIIACMKSMMKKALCAVAISGCLSSVWAQNVGNAAVNCQKEQDSMIDQKFCESQAMKKTKNRLIAQRNKLLKDTEAEYKNQMVQWFRAADKYADAYCEVQGLDYDGGSMQGLVILSCLNGEYAKQIKMLKSYEKRMENN